MKLLMLCREPRLYSCQRLQLAAQQLGHQLDILDPNRFLLKLEQGRLCAYYHRGDVFDKQRQAPEKLPQYDGILPRFGTSSTEIGCYILRHYELQGVPVLNDAESFRLARDKWQSLQKLAAQGLTVPNTAISGELVSTSAVAECFPHPLIIKTLLGSQGVGVMLSPQKSMSVSLIDTLKAAHIKTLSQQFISESQGKDIRALVIGNEVVAAMLRQGTRGEFRANIHQGGNAETIQLNAEEQQLAIQATKAIGLDVAGVDLIQSKTGPMILEVNASPGLEMIEKVSKMDIAQAMIQMLIQRIQTQNEQKTSGKIER